MLGFVLNVLIHGLNQKTIFIRIFRVLHTVQFSRNFFVVAFILSSNSFILSYRFRFVKNFLTFLKKFFLHKLKRRRRDLNPRAATNDLLPFQGSPFNHLGTSALVDSHLAFCKIDIQFCTRNSSLWLRSTVSGESGIRTHAPLRTNGFQDRLVMTTSISLQSALSNVLINNTPQYHFCQAFFQVFFVFLFFSNCIQNMLFPCIAIINIWYSHVIYPINSFLLLKRIFSEFF